MSSKSKYTLEFFIRASPKILFDRISTPEGLSEWFADDVNIKGNQFTFFWDGYGQDAELISKKDLKHSRFRWLDENEDEFFEFRIEIDELTNDVAFIVTDFAEEDEKQDSIDLWESQVSELKQALGV